MIKSSIFSILFALTLAIPTASQAAPAAAKQWDVNNTDRMTPATQSDYKRGDAKAELEWSSTPVYEWQIQDQSASGGRVHFALFNKRVNKYLVYQFKNYGINLGLLNVTPQAPQSFSLALQMKTLYDQATPQLSINFLACLTTPTSQSISVTFLNITYKLDD